MKFRIATIESSYRGQPTDFIHVFLEMRDGNYLSFFEVPSLASLPGPDPNDWAQHFAFRVRDLATVDTVKDELEARGIDVDGPVVRPPFHSIYFRDPNNHRMEVTALDPVNDGRYRPDEERANEVLGDWNSRKSNTLATQKA